MTTWGIHTHREEHKGHEAAGIHAHTQREREGENKGVGGGGGKVRLVALLIRVLLYHYVSSPLLPAPMAVEVDTAPVNVTGLRYPINQPGGQLHAWGNEPPAYLPLAPAFSPPWADR